MLEIIFFRCFDLLIIFIISLHIFISYIYFQFLAVNSGNISTLLVHIQCFLSSRERVGFSIQLLCCSLLLWYITVCCMFVRINIIKTLDLYWIDSCENYFEFDFWWFGMNFLKMQIADVAITADGTCQGRAYSSLNGAGTIIGIDNGKCSDLYRKCVKLVWPGNH